MSVEPKETPISQLMEVQNQTFLSLTSDMYWQMYHRYVNASDLIRIETWEAHALRKLKFEQSNSMRWFYLCYQVIARYYRDWMFPNGQLVIQFDPILSYEQFLEREWRSFFRVWMEGKLNNDEFVRDFIHILVAENEGERDFLCRFMAISIGNEFQRSNENPNVLYQSANETYVNEEE